MHVDDDISILEISKLVLLDIDNSFEIDHASNVYEAFKKLAVVQYDVVISDYDMPGMNGLQFLEELREKNNDIPFILFTGKGREEIVIKALNLGADAYTNKQGNTETVYGELAHSVQKTIERKRAKKLLAKNQDRLRRAQAIARVGNWELDLRTQKMWASEEAYKIYGLEQVSDFLPLKLVQQVPLPEFRSILNSALEDLITNNKEYNLEFKIKRHNDGQERFIHSQAELIIDESKTPIMVNGVLQDVTERKKTEDTLRKSEARYRELANFLPETIFEADLTGRITFFNKQGFEITGFSQEELEKGLSALSFVAPEERERATKNLKRTMAGEDIGTQEYTLLAKDGTTYPALVRTRAIISENRLVGLRGLVVDMTERKKAEEALIESEENYSNLINGMGESAWVIDFDGNFVDVNDAAVKALGYSKEELLSLGIKDIDKFLSPQQVKNLMDNESSARAQVFETEHTTKDKEKIPVEISTSLITYHGKPAHLAIARNISERKKAEEALKIAASIFDLVTDSIFVHDTDGNIVNFNGAAYKLRGYSKEEMVKMNVHDLDSPESAKLFKPTMDEVLKKGVAVFESVHVCKDKSLLPVEIHARLIELEGKTLILSVARDVTERKVAEKKLQENNYRIEMMNEKLRVVGSLARHDVRNKLSTVNGYAYLLKKKHADHTDIVEGLGEIEQQVKDCVKIFEFAKMYEQLGVEELAYVDVGNTVDEAVALFSGLTIKIVNDCRGASVLADSFLRQMFYNFIDNTTKYGEKATTIKVHCEKAESGELRLVYEDDGVGISAENKAKLFTEGFSTGGSTGFGLFFIKKMMNVYGWTITEEGEPGKGAKFIITIPRGPS